MVFSFQSVSLNPCNQDTTCFIWSSSSDVNFLFLSLIMMSLILNLLIMFKQYFLQFSNCSYVLAFDVLILYLFYLIQPVSKALQITFLQLFDTPESFYISSMLRYFNTFAATYNDGLLSGVSYFMLFIGNFIYLFIKDKGKGKEFCYIMQIYNNFKIQDGII